MLEILRWLLDCQEKSHPKYIYFSNDEFLLLSMKILNRYNIPFWHLVKMSRKKLQFWIHWHIGGIYIHETEWGHWIEETRQRKKVPGLSSMFSWFRKKDEIIKMMLYDGDDDNTTNIRNIIHNAAEWSSLFPSSLCLPNSDYHTYIKITHWKESKIIRTNDSFSYRCFTMGFLEGIPGC